MNFGPVPRALAAGGVRQIISPIRNRTAARGLERCPWLYSFAVPQCVSAPIAVPALRTVGPRRRNRDPPPTPSARPRMMTRRQQRAFRRPVRRIALTVGLAGAAAGAAAAGPTSTVPASCCATASTRRPHALLQPFAASGAQGDAAFAVLLGEAALQTQRGRGRAQFERALAAEPGSVAAHLGLGRPTSRSVNTRVRRSSSRPCCASTTSRPICNCAPRSTPTPRRPMPRAGGCSPPAMPSSARALPHRRGRRRPARRRLRLGPRRRQPELRARRRRRTRREPGLPLPRLRRRGTAQRLRTCAGTRRTAATSAS